MITSTNISTISDLRFKTKQVLKDASREPVLVFRRNKPEGVLLSFEKYQELMDILEDFYLSVKAEDYEEEGKEKVKWIPHPEIKKLLNV